MKMMFPHTRMNRSLGELASDVNSLVDTLFGSSGTTVENAVGITPRMDIQETDDHFSLSLDLPGIKSEDVHIDLEEDDLVIRGSRSSAAETDGERYHRVERWFGEFRRSVRLPRTVDRESIVADYSDGVLTVTLPKVKAAATRKISIRAGATTQSHDSAHPSTGEQPAS